MNFDVRRLAGNKTVLYGMVAVGAAAGGLVFLRKRNSSSAPTSSGDDTASTGTVAGGYPDSSATDVGDLYGQAESQINGQLAQFMTAVSDLQDTLDGLHPTGGGTSPAPPAHPVPKVPPKGAPRKGGHPIETVTVQAYRSRNAPWQSTLSGIAGHEHTTVAALERANGIKNPKSIHKGQKIRIPR